MEKKQDTFYLIIAVAIVGIMIGAILVLLPLRFSLLNQNIEIPAPQKPMVSTTMYQFAENLYDSSEMFFDYTVYNYGSVEVKNIVVRCKLWDTNDNLVKSDKHTFGNLASNSTKLGELITSNIPNFLNTEYVAMCYVESCDNCDILWKKIPDLVEAYEN